MNRIAQLEKINNFLLQDNKRVYAKLCKCKERIYNLLSDYDIETALAGSIAYHQDRFELDRVAKITGKLVIERELQYILQDEYRLNLSHIRKNREEINQIKEELLKNEAKKCQKSE